MRKFAVALALTASACSYQSPTQPAASAAATATNEPFSLTLGSSVGSGTTADHATITAKVQGPTGQPLGGVVVTFSTTVGALNPEQAATDSNGIGSTTLVASTAATVTAKAGTLSARTGVGTQPAAQPPPTPTPTPVPGPNPGATPTGPLTVTLTAADVIVGSTTILNVSIKDGVPPFQVTWTFGDGASFTGSSSSSAHVYAAVGAYPASVNVTDSAGRTASANATVNVLAAPPPPAPPAPPPATPSYTVTLSASPTTVVAGGTATLTAAVNAQNGAPTPTSFDWDCDGDNIYETLGTASNTKACTYSLAGSITSHATAHGGSVSGVGSTTVTVQAAPDLTVSIVPSSFTPAIGASTDFTATVTSAGSVPATFKWEWDDDGDGTFDFTIATAASPNTRAITFGTSGPHTVKVRITDTATGRTATGSRSVTVP